MSGHTGLVDLLRVRAIDEPTRPAYAFLTDGERVDARLDAASVDLRARAVAARLQESARAGDRVLICHPTSPRYIESFLGCMYAGCVAVPCDAPRTESAERLAGIRADTDPVLVLAAPSEAERSAALAGLPVVDVASVPNDASSAWLSTKLDPASPAFLQYTSGSTRQPRGVVVTHRNLMANEEAISRACGNDEQSTFVGWLPLFHDMGLIANALQPLFLGSLAVLMPPTAFLARPARWLEAITQFRARVSGGPNFAYDLCSSRVSAEERRALDLSSWAVAFNGAEPVRAATMRRFAEVFAPQGFDASAHMPTYGLAEATLIVAATPTDRRPLVVRADSERLRLSELGPARAGAPAVEVVSSGIAVSGTRIAVVDPELETTCADNRIGEIWVQGTSVAAGYWNSPTESRAMAAVRADAADGPWLRTGDLGALSGGELYVIGRLKDLIIVRGRNHYPHDLERTAESAAPALRSGTGAAFATTGELGESVTLCYELRSYESPLDVEELGFLLRDAFAAEHGLTLDKLVVLRRGGIPKTTSGKVQRARCRARWLAGELPVLAQTSIRRTLVDLPATAELSDVVTALLVAAPVGSGVDSPISSLGLDSLAAVDLSHRIGSSFGVTISPHVLLGDITIGDLANRVVVGAQSRAMSSRIAPALLERTTVVDPRSQPGWLPLTPGQLALWFDQQVSPDSGAHTLSRALEFAADTDPRVLAAEVDSVVDRHPALSSRIAETSSGPAYRAGSAALHCRTVDDRGLSDDEFRDALNRRAAEPLDPAFVTARVTLHLRASGPVLLLHAHHLVADLWSLTVLVRELLDAVRGDPYSDPQLLLLAQARAQAVQEKSDREYWQRRLFGARVDLELRIDYPRPPERGFRGATRTIELPSRLAGDLDTLATQHRTTLFTVLLSAYASALHLATGQDDLLIGVPLAQRHSPESAGAVGYFVDLVPFRSTCTDAESVADRLARCRTGLLEAMEHSGQSLIRTAQDVGGVSTAAAGRNSLVQTQFVLQREHGVTHDGFGALSLGVDGRVVGRSRSARIRPIERRWSALDVSVSAAVVDGRIISVWEYRTDLFDAATVDALAQRWIDVLEASTWALADLAGDSSKLAESVDSATESDGWSVERGPEVARDPWWSVSRMVDAAERAAPDSIAVSWSGEGLGRGHLSRAGLRRAVDDVASRLRSAGVVGEDRVGVYCHRGAWLPVAYLAVMQSGATVVPLDPDDPVLRTVAALASADVVAVLSDSPNARRLRFAGTILELGPETQAAPASARPRRVRLHPSHAAYLLFTSGSTGEPKGVVVDHEALANRLAWMQETYGQLGGERVLHKTPVSFDVSIWELLWPLTAGGCVVMAVPGAHRDPRRIVATADTEQITTMHVVPSVLGAFLSEIEFGVHTLPALRRVICSGEELTRGLLRRARTCLAAEVHNLYGPTEAAIDVTAWHCSADEDGPVPIGRPVANTVVAVHSPREDGTASTIGRLYLGGVQLARGYHRAPGRTATAFVPAHGSQRYYDTGDLVDRRADGPLVFRGRTDDQVKIGGRRIEPAEVAEALRKHPAVDDAFVIAYDGQLIGFVTPRSDSFRSNESSIRNWLRRSLPAALVPSRIVSIESLPTSSNGKLDRSELRRRLLKLHGGSTGDLRPPRSAIELALAETWNGLPVRVRDIDDNFFGLGGDSLRAIDAIARSRALGLPVRVSDLLRFPTIRQLAQFVAGQSSVGIGDRTVAPFALCPEAAGRTGVEDAYPISMAQRAILHHAGSNPGYEVYVTSVAVRGQRDEKALRQAIDGVVARHGYLRSWFDLTTYTEPIQLVGTAGAESVQFHDDPVDGIDRWISVERKTPFDTDVGPLVRFNVHRGTEGFRLSISSFALDGWCDAQLLSEVLEDYSALLDGRAPTTTTPATEYREFVALESAARTDPYHRTYWTNALLGASVTRIPRRGDVEPPQSGAGADLQPREVVQVPQATRWKLQSLADELGVSLKHVLLGIHLGVVRAITGRVDLVTAAEVTGRPERAGGDRVIGVFNNILPIRARVEGQTWAELATLARDLEVDTAEVRRMPLADLARTSPAARQLDTLFVYTHFRRYQELNRLDNLTVDDLKAPDQTYVPLTAHANLDAAEGGTLRLLVEADPRQFSADHAREIADEYRTALEDAASEPFSSSRTGAAGWRRRKLDPEMRATRELSEVGSLGSMFRAAARQFPDRVAVTAASDVLTYRGLDHAARGLGSVLVAHGVRPGDVVAVWADRSARAICAVLSTVHAGAAWLSLDPAHPAERNRAAIEAVGASVLIAPAGHDAAWASGVLVVDNRASSPYVGPRVQHPDALATVFMTSGSTGSPKPVGVPHRGLSSYLVAAQREYGVNEETVAPVQSSFCVDLTVTSLLLPLTVGGSVRLLADDPAALGVELALGRATFLKLTPGHLSALDAAGAGCANSVRTVVVGGDNLSAAHVRSARRLTPNADLINEYGPTETVVGCCTHTVDGEDGVGLLPIGRPLGGAWMEVIDDRAPARVGVAGELVVGGSGVTRGYLGRPGATAESFVPDPVGTAERCYRTGDSAHRRIDDLLVCLGRMDRQLNIRGHRIEPGEIEHVLSVHRGVREAIVVSEEGPDGRGRLVAFWVAESPTVHPSVVDLRRWVADRLPSQFVPVEFRLLPAMPLTPGGKVAIDELPNRSRWHAELAERISTMSDSDVAEALLATAGTHRVSSEGTS